MPNVKRFLAFILIFLLLAGPAWAAHQRLEKDYQREWCVACGGELEHVLPDGARVDCLTDEYAIEFDFAVKWAEAIGQALYYAFMTGKRPGIVLIMEKADDVRYLERLLPVAELHGITVWTMGPGAPK